jgi:PAS domain S-box-containing protein
MNLQKKILILVGIAYVAFIIVTHVLTNTLLLQHIDTIESQDITNDMERVRGLILYQSNLMSDTCSDWAQWDDTYAFVNDSNGKYINANLVDETFDTLRINFILFYDASDNLVYGKGYDLAEMSEVAVPEGLPRDLTGDPLLRQASASGIMILGNSPVLLAAQPILTSNEEGPTRGTLIMGRYIDDAELSQLAELAHISLEIQSYIDTELPGNFQVARAGISEAQPVFVRPLDLTTLTGFITMEDIYGQPAILIKGDTIRDDYLPIRAFGNSLIFGFIVLGTLVTIMAILALNRWLLLPLSSLSKSIGNISLKGSPAGRVPVKGKDEIASVASKVNEMLGALEQGQKDLSESMEKYRDLFDNAHDMIQSITPNGQIQYTNPAWRKTLGYTEEEIKNLNFYSIIHPDSLENCRALFQQVFTGSELMQLEADFITKDRQQISVIGSASCRFVDGRPTDIRSIFHNVTELKQIHDELKDLYESEKSLRYDLREEIGKRIEFTRVLAHELKNSLTSLMASSELIVDEFHDEPWNSLAKNIYRSTTHLHNRVKEMLDMARMEMGTLQIQLLPVEPLKILKALADDIKPLAASRGQAIALELPPSLPTITADGDRLWQIVQNLLDNASKFTPSGGTITIGAEVQPPYLVIYIRDTGKGMKESETTRLFDFYHRVEEDREHMSGLGLGLALCKNLVEVHGGKIWVSSKKGAGSTFYFSIPLNHSKPA